MRPRCIVCNFHVIIYTIIIFFFILSFNAYLYIPINIIHLSIIIKFFNLSPCVHYIILIYLCYFISCMLTRKYYDNSNSYGIIL